MPQPLSIYIHWPFCLKKCPYCDFNSHVRAGGFDEDDYLKCLLKEMDYWAAQGLKGRSAGSVFFGGGTPSLMKVSTVEAILKKLNQYWPLTSTTEITLEANPTSIEAEKFKDLAKIGVNRLSVGIQSLDDEVLKFLGREHSSKEAIAALSIAKAHFDNVNFDLIYARPGQSLDDWQNELAKALAFNCSHMSLYQLTIEPDTRFETLYDQGRLIMPEGDLAADFYEQTNQQMKEAGFEAYEVSNYAKPGFECVHNLTYWRYKDYLGLGPGAHGRVKVGRVTVGRVTVSRVMVNGETLATANFKRPEQWSDQVKEKGHGCEIKEALTGKQAATEMILMGLRTMEGLDLKGLESRFGARFDEERVNELKAQGLVQIDEGFLRTTDQGRLLLGGVIERLVAGLSYYA